MPSLWSAESTSNGFIYSMDIALSNPSMVKRSLNI